MKNNRGFIISTTLYSVFGILLLTIFYILYILANNRMTMTTFINNLKSKLERGKTIVEAYGIDNYPETISTFEVRVKQSEGLKQIKYYYAQYDASVHTLEFVRDSDDSVTVCNSEDSDIANDCSEEVKKQLDANTPNYNCELIDDEYKNCSIYTADGENTAIKYYSDDNSKHKSFILYVKDAYDVETLYTITPKIKIEHTGPIIGSKGVALYKILNDGTLIYSHGEYTSGGDVPTYTTLKIARPLNVLATHYIGGSKKITRMEFKINENDIYIYAKGYNNDYYYKITKDSVGGSSTYPPTPIEKTGEEIDEDDYDDAIDNSTEYVSYEKPKDDIINTFIDSSGDYRYTYCYSKNTCDERYGKTISNVKYNGTLISGYVFKEDDNTFVTYTGWEARNDGSSLISASPIKYEKVPEVIVEKIQ